MNEERLRQLYGRGMAGRDARSELAGACAVEPERLLALVRRELPETERLSLLDEVMSSRACREAFELLRVVDAAGRAGDRGPVASLEMEGDGEENDARSVPTRTDPTRTDPARSDPTPAGGPAPLTLLSNSPAAPPPLSGRPLPTAAPAVPWWRRNGASIALAASALLAVGLFARGRSGDEVEPTRGVGDGVVLLAPATSPAAGVGISSFVWHSVQGAMRYEFELLDTKGESLYQAATTDTVIAWPAEVTLQPGVEYRWLVRALTTGGQRSSPARPLLVPPR